MGVADGLLDVAGQVLLAAPGPAQLAEVPDHPVDGRRHPGQGLDLPGVLAHPQLAGDGRGGRERGPGQGVLEPEQEGAPQPVSHPEAPPGRPGRGQGAGDQPHRVVGLGPDGHLDLEPAQVVPGQRGLQGGHDQPGLAVGRQHQHGQPLQGRGPVAGQVLEVGRRPQQQRVDAPLGLLLARPGQPLGTRRNGCRHRDNPTSRHTLTRSTRSSTSMLTGGPPAVRQPSRTRAIGSAVSTATRRDWYSRMAGWGTCRP
jgi:hypothetical protein